jgi:hypothetical protein
VATVNSCKSLPVIAEQAIKEKQNMERRLAACTAQQRQLQAPECRSTATAGCVMCSSANASRQQPKKHVASASSCVQRNHTTTAYDSDSVSRHMLPNLKRAQQRCLQPSAAAVRTNGTHKQSAHAQARPVSTTAWCATYLHRAHRYKKAHTRHSDSSRAQKCC